MERRRKNYPRHSAPRIDIPTDEIITLYTAGESLKSLAARYGCDRSAIKNRLVRSGVPIRGRSEAEKEKWKRIKQDREKVVRQCGAAWEAAKSERSFDQTCRLAMMRYLNQSQIHAGENEIAKAIQERGLLVLQQFPVGPYNLDIAVAERGIAVEVVGTNWHPNTAVSLFKRTKYLLDCCWAVVFVFTWSAKATKAFRPDLIAEQVIALAQGTGSDPSPWGKYGMVNRQGEPISLCREYLDGLPIIEGFEAAMDSACDKIAG